MDLTGSFIKNIGRHSEFKLDTKGRKVFFKGVGGRKEDWDYACKHIEFNTLLTVKEIYVGSSSSVVSFIEIPDLKFSTVLFEDIWDFGVGSIIQRWGEKFLISYNECFMSEDRMLLEIRRNTFPYMLINLSTGEYSDGVRSLKDLGGKGTFYLGHIRDCAIDRWY